MSNLLRYGGWTLLALVTLWVVAEVIGFVLGVVSWVVSGLVTILLAAVLLYLAYALVSRFLGGGDGKLRSRSESREREKIYE
jgi:membrane protein implicated in regulation of membrane protease activity